MATPDSEAAARLESLRQENAELERELSSLRNFMTSMSRLSAAIDSPRGTPRALTLLEEVLDTVIQAVGAVDGSLLAPDDDTGELVFVLVRGASPDGALVGRRIPRGAGIAGWAAENRRATIVNNVSADERFYSVLDVETEYRTSSLLAAPLVGGGRVLGVIEVINKADGGLFSTGNQTLLTLMCRYAGELLFSMIRDVDLSQELERQDISEPAAPDRRGEP